jgi:RecB family exonuclease
MSISPWSFSRIKSFEQCPKQFYHVKILKDYAESETEAMRYGTEAHLVAEEFIGSDKPIPKKFEYMKPKMDTF